MDDRPTFFCAKCGKRGHTADKCRKFQFDKNRSNQTDMNSSTSQARPAQNDESGTSMYASSVAYSARRQEYPTTGRAQQRLNRKHYKKLNRQNFEENFQYTIPNELNGFGSEIDE